jgi:hypothetical protein
LRFSPFFLGYEAKDDEMGETCSTHGREMRHAGNILDRKCGGKRPLVGELAVYGRILKWLLDK